MKGAIKYFFLWVALTFVGLLALIMIYRIVSLCIPGFIFNENDLVGDNMLASFTTMMATQVLPLYVFIKKKYTSFSFGFKYSYGPDFSTKKFYLWVVVAAVGCLLFDFSVIWAFPVLDEWNTIVFGPSDDAPTFNFLELISAGVLAPLAEEALFRGAIERSLLEKNWKPWLAIVITAFLFALPHGRLFAFISLLVLIICWLYYRTGCIWPGIVMHAINNNLLMVPLFIAVLFLGESAAQDEVSIPLSITIPMLLLGLAIVCLSVRQIARMTKDRTPLEPVVEPTGEL